MTWLRNLLKGRVDKSPPAEPPAFAWPPEERTEDRSEPGAKDSARLPAPYEAVAARLAELEEADNAACDRLSEKQLSLSRDKAYLDRLVRGEEPLKNWLRTIVEIRFIGHRLNEEGGKPLMRQVAERAGALSRSRATLRTIEADWDEIGQWRG